jgi:hypothetical protein
VFAQQIQVGIFPSSVALGDFDGDTVPDIATTTIGSGSGSNMTVTLTTP